MLWKRLYGVVWLAFFLCVLIPRWMGNSGLPLHAVLGLLILILTQSNVRKLAVSGVPARLQRIGKATAGIAVFQVVCGAAISGVHYLAPNLPFVLPALRVVHIVCALAILAQASSVATAYDMWEEKEFIGSAAENAKKAI